MPKRKDQKNKLVDLAELQNDPGSARGDDFVIENENTERNKYTKKAKGKPQLTSFAAPRPNRSAKK